MDRDVMLITTLWAYQTTYKVTTQYTPFELVYSAKPIMPIELVIPNKWVCDILQEDLDKAIRVRIEDLFRLDEIHWKASENINHIQLLHKEQKDEKVKMKSFMEGNQRSVIITHQPM